jgi:WD40 repeat protein
LLTFTAAGDLNGDFRPDILFQDGTGLIAYWSMQGASMTVADALTPNTVYDPDWKAVGCGDFNSDGKPDLIFQHADGSLAVWLMDGINLHTSSFLQPTRPEDARWLAVGTGDFHGEGKWELALRHDDGTLAFWTMDGLKRTNTCFPVAVEAR